MVTEQGSPSARQGVLQVRAMVIRDGTPGISLSLGSRLLGEWTDSRARTLAVREDLKVKILGAGGELLYLFSVPGKVLSATMISDKEVTISFEL